MKVELLAPAGDLERLKTAVIYGANAVYFGGKQFSLRARASNFTLEDIEKGVQFAHEHGAKAYVTVNMIPHNSDFEGLRDYLHILNEIGVDAIICASQAILAISKEVAPDMEVHISTQQTTMNSKAIEYWQKKGADRIVLGREATYDELLKIMEKTTLPVEVFIHGGMCANYSGRCTISNVLTNRDANRGGCAQSCRWDYHLYHNDELLDRELPFSLGSKDMSSPEYIERLMRSGACSFKIEGRMKTAFYLANVIKGYRQLMDAYENKGTVSEEDLVIASEYLNNVANRETFPGFYPGIPDGNGQIYNNVNTANQMFVANVVSYDEETSLCRIEARNHFEKGDKLIVLRPEGRDYEFIADDIRDEEGNEVIVANKPMQILTVKLPCAADGYCYIYRK